MQRVLSLEAHILVLYHFSTQYDMPVQNKQVPLEFFGNYVLGNTWADFLYDPPYPLFKRSSFLHEVRPSMGGDVVSVTQKSSVCTFSFAFSVILHLPKWFILLPPCDLRTVFDGISCDLGLIFLKVSIWMQFVPDPESSFTLTLDSIHLIVENHSLSYWLSVLSMFPATIVSMKYSSSLSSGSIISLTV